MQAGMLCMALGIALIAPLPELPPLALFVGAAGLLLATVRWRRHRLWVSVTALLIGAGWGTAYGHYIRDGLLPTALEQQPLLLRGQIRGLVERDLGFGRKPVLRFEFEVDQCLEADGAICGADLHRIRLSWYEADDAPQPGERWQLPVKLKRPRGFANPGGFDYEAWLVANRIGAVGYVDRKGDAQRLAPASHWSLASLRGAARDHLAQRLTGMKHRDLLLGLLVGDGNSISQARWQTFRATGTVHLFVVSGLQVAFTGGLVLWLTQLLWRTPFAAATRRNAWLSALPALAVATAYALLAGFGLPLQRALIMFAVLLMAVVARREISAASGWIFSLCLVLLCDPLAVRDVGFWFSFIAVAALLLAVCGHRARRLKHWRWWRAQLAVFFASLPVLLALSGQFTLLALPANLLAIPLSTLISMPLAFLALLVDPLSLAAGEWLWHAADISLDWLVTYLEWLQQHGAALIWNAAGVDGVALLFAAAFALLMLLPRGFPGRPLAFVLLLPLLAPRLDTLAEGELRVTVVDVGQGLAVLAETATHSLLYDTGPPFGPARNVADLAITPLLRQRGIERLDTVVVSHRDSDHAAGLVDLQREFDIDRLLVGESLGDTAPAEFCRAGMRWHWDGVTFEMLYPSASGLRGNAASCVLRVSSGAHSLLLTGDIDAAAEARLLLQDQLRASTLLVAPHHGSGSSSTSAFIEQVQPRYVVFSSGYRNRFGHPSPAVQARYREAGAARFNTASDGALIFKFSADAVPHITRQRSRMRHYWDGKWDSERGREMNGELD